MFVASTATTPFSQGPPLTVLFNSFKFIACSILYFCLALLYNNFIFVWFSVSFDLKKLPVTARLLDMEKENVDSNAGGSVTKKRRLSLSLKKHSGLRMFQRRRWNPLLALPPLKNSH